MSVASGSVSTPSEKCIIDRVRSLSRVLDAHAGGLEFLSFDEGVVTVRFTGMCTGCPLRTVTMAGLIRPALLELAGVDSVQAHGVRISREAEERMHQLMSQGSSSRLLHAVGGVQQPARPDDGESGE